MGYKNDSNVRLGDNVIVEDGVLFGNNITIEDDVVIRKGAEIGDNVTVGYRDIRPIQDNPSKPTITEIGRKVKIRSGGVIYWGTRIGHNSKIGHNTVIRENTIIGHDTYVGSLTTIEGDTKIGNYVGIHNQCFVTKFCDIGDYTFIAPLFVNANDPAIAYKRAGGGQNLIGFTTEKYVRIAINVVVLPGVRFGEGSIVASGSVVTKDVPPYKLVMGAPARVVRDAPKQEIREELLTP
jgi:UDP-2-acetamido-3-amino-2,3-dideoxy-glucuronate N-acetyltransferase